MIESSQMRKLSWRQGNFAISQLPGTCIWGKEKPSLWWAAAAAAMVAARATGVVGGAAGALEGRLLFTSGISCTRKTHFFFLFHSFPISFAIASAGSKNPQPVRHHLSREKKAAAWTPWLYPLLAFPYFLSCFFFIRYLYFLFIFFFFYGTVGPSLVLTHECNASAPSEKCNLYNIDLSFWWEKEKGNDPFLLLQPITFLWMLSGRIPYLFHGLCPQSLSHRVTLSSNLFFIDGGRRWKKTPVEKRRKQMGEK